MEIFKSKAEFGKCSVSALEMLQELCWRNERPDGTCCAVITLTLCLVAEAGNFSTSASTAVKNSA